MRSSELRAINAPFGNVADFILGTRRLERVTVRSDDLAKRVLRISTSVGDVGIRFNDGRRLRDGDIVHLDEALAVVIDVASDQVLIVSPADIAEAVDVAHALGNRHVPIQRDGAAILIRDDPVLAALLVELRVVHRREARKLVRPFRHAPMSHAHE